MMKVRVWVVVWVVCLASHAHGQLGVRGVHEDSQGLDTPITNQLLPNEQEKGQEGEGGNTVSDGGHRGPEQREEWRWRPLLDTYQGCYDWEEFNGTLMYVNLTQVMEDDHLDSVEHACFHMCRVKKPLSMYIALSPAVNSGADGCGCQDLLDDGNKMDDEECDNMVDHYRVYCGPYHTECLNQGGVVVLSSLLLCLPLIALLRSFVLSDGDVHSWS